MNFKKNLIFGVVLVFLFLPQNYYSQNKICDYCKKEITSGKYLQVEGKYFHENHFICSHCSSKINGGYFQHDGKYLHDYCYKNHVLDKCEKCYKPIEGAYVTSAGKIYHKNCYEKHIALKCNLCDSNIDGNYYKDFWGNIVHWEHLSSSKECEYCRRIISSQITNGGKVFTDGRHICNLCGKSSVTTKYKSKQLFDEAKFKLQLEGIKIGDVEIELHLVNLTELKKIVKDNHKNNVRGYSTYNYRKQNGKIINREFDIYILNNMPQSYFIKVAAHELMHIWQYLNSPEDNNKTLSEGSCEYASYLVVKKYYGKYYDFIKKNFNENEDPVYGGGFKRVKKFVDKNSKRAWLKLLKSKEDFPRGY
ncbi:MAG: protein DA1 [Ignavibacteriae bacterium]|nr:hypothetical protein [Ignavibacteriota bacterium]NOG97790.1 protein DA1 [Ignavibacteriota bacterium]